MKTTTSATRRLYRWFKRNIYWVIVCASLATIIILQERGPARIQIGQPVVAHQLPAYADLAVIIPDRATTLEQYLKLLTDQTHIRIDFLSAAGEPTTGPNAPLPALPANCTLAEAVAMLHEATKDHLSAYYEPDRILLAPSDFFVSPAQCTTIVYPIADLLTIDDPRLAAITREVRISQIIDTIRATVAPEGWHLNGGPDTISELDGKLIITATGPMYRDIELLLRALRQH